MSDVQCNEPPTRHRVAQAAAVQAKTFRHTVRSGRQRRPHASIARVDHVTTPDGRRLGPLWLGGLNDPAFVRRALDAARAAAPADGAPRPEADAARQLAALLERSLADAPSLPPFSYQVPGSAAPAAVVAALHARGYGACRSAFDGDGAKAASRRVRTDAPADVRREVGLAVGS